MVTSRNCPPSPPRHPPQLCALPPRGTSRLFDAACSERLEAAYSSPPQPHPLVADAARVRQSLDGLKSKAWRARHAEGVLRDLPDLVRASAHPALFLDCGWRPADGAFGAGHPTLADAHTALRRLVSQERLALHGTDCLVDFSVGDERLLPLAPATAGCLRGVEGPVALQRVSHAHPLQLYRCMNRAIHRREGLERWRFFIYCLDQALAALPAGAPPHVYRGLGKHFDVVAEYGEGRVVCWPAFSSSSASQEVADDFIRRNTETKALKDGTVFIVKPRGCRDISMWSRFPREHEYLFPSNSRFQVIKNLGRHAWF